MLKAPQVWSERSKLQHDETLSNFAFNFNLRRYATVLMAGVAAALPLAPMAVVLPMVVLPMAVGAGALATAMALGVPLILAACLAEVGDLLRVFMGWLGNDYGVLNGLLRGC
jgi:NADPH-dependent 2,4-dienoyl-CoA reductase/sulfur reductase-like enzyme